MDTSKFVHRHVGIAQCDLPEMLKAVGVDSVDVLIKETIPSGILLKEPIDLPEPMSERELQEHLAELASKNEIYTSYIGMGWYDTIVPAPIIRNVLENPAWYTSYTPYQSEVSQGRLEALFNFQTLITELTALPLTNCSLLDEATAAAEAVNMFYGDRSRAKVKAGANKLFVDEKVFASTLAVLKTRTVPQGIEMVIGDYDTFVPSDEYFAAVIQYTNTDGRIRPYESFVKHCEEKDIKVAVGADLMSLVILTPPGEWGVDVVYGSAQRFGVPMYFGGPSAGFMATKDTYKRSIPGRIIGISKDAYGRPAYRLALQTREQHIKRERATSNICTAQALLATMSSFYAVYHGPKGLKDIANRIHAYASYISDKLEELGYKQENDNFFDTLKVYGVADMSGFRELSLECKVNFRYYEDGAVGISIDETTQIEDLGVILYIFSSVIGKEMQVDEQISTNKISFDPVFERKTDFLTYPVFNKYHTETELMRYIKRLERKDISLAHSMIPLGSCTMKLNAASEVMFLSRPEFCNIHPYAPSEQVQGSLELIENLGKYLSVITGFDAVSFQPNSGAAGEYAGLRTIRAYLESVGQGHRDRIILPASAHGTNPASAVQCGYKTVTVDSDKNGNVDMDDFRKKCEENKDSLAGIMITYPSTHGIFEQDIVEICDTIHACGGQVYMDGANMNAQVALTNPGYIGADVCHLNLHKTFAIPHGGGGPGAGPICVKRHLEPFLPSHPIRFGDDRNTVASAPFGSAGILLITYAYIRMLGEEGLRQSTQTAILNANYMAAKLKDTFGIVFSGKTGRVGHELILDCRKLKELSGVDENDVAKRLMDFGYHAPTLSFPVHGTLMIEPTESESKSELDRFIQVMDCIWEEIQEIVRGDASAEDNVLKNAPHPQYEITADEWSHVYSRSKAAYPLDYLNDNKFWINVARVDNGFGDRNLIASACGAKEIYEGK